MSKSYQKIRMDYLNVLTQCLKSYTLYIQIILIYPDHPHIITVTDPGEISRVLFDNEAKKYRLSFMSLSRFINNSKEYKEYRNHYFSEISSEANRITPEDMTMFIREWIDDILAEAAKICCVDREECGTYLVKIVCQHFYALYAFYQCDFAEDGQIYVRLIEHYNHSQIKGAHTK